MTTSKRVAKIAGPELANPKTPKKYRPPIAAALEEAKGAKPSKKKPKR
ncbi:MAG: hypothetical protein ABSC48_08520 [Terracidiphilus sp.]|jgi:hypothetical protein